MAGDNHGDKTQEEPQTQEDLRRQQAAQEQPQVNGADREKAVAGIDGNLSVATSVQVVESTVTTAIDDLDELADLDF